ncbi:hypothetical protein [Thermococcus sp.]|uniref:hypothetical protein n=1 Tax=Thermococcus sp. TaxID=35749 RepID=UPI0025ED4EF8|nr:hypothetical protein [Thermococcus sp.]
MLFSYFKGLTTNGFYLALFPVTLAISLRLPGINEPSPYPLLLVLGITWVFLPIVDARDVLKVDEFLLGLPSVREKLAVLSALALLLPLLPILLRGGISTGLLGVLSTFVSTLLFFNSVFALFFAPLAFVFPLIQCSALRVSSLVALTGPYALWAFGALGRFFSLRVVLRGFQISPRYAMLSVLPVLVFEGLYNGPMGFVIADYIGFRNPDFSPLTFLLFSIFALVFISVPYFTAFGLREAELHLGSTRALLGTPLGRRSTAFVLALALELPVAFFMVSLKHFVVSPENAMKLAIAGAFFNTALPTGGDSKWSGYSFMGYMVALHFLLPRLPLWYVLGASFLLSVLLYDLDVWRYGA